MMRSSMVTVVGFLLVQFSIAQEELTKLWIDNQINITWCQWAAPRVGTIRDTLYIDGGALSFYRGLNDGTYGDLVTDGNPTGLIYKLNFSTPFTTTDNFSTIMTNMTKAGQGTANNIAPNSYDGAMFANDEQWVTYGGEMVDSSAYASPGANWAAKYEQYLSGPDRLFAPGWQTMVLPQNVTRYITGGAAVSVPSEDLGYYFAGLRAADSGAFGFLPGTASTLSMTMIEIDMTTQDSEKWRNLTLPDSIGGRANPEVVWIPVSERGVLIAIGGVVNPSFATAAQKLNASQTAESKRISPGFMSTVAIYDIKNERWYEQETTGSIPPQLTQGCSVVASAQDGSSHNIYWYGGYDGITLTSSDMFTDDVWVLSVPSFQWTKVKSGDFVHARARHRCVKPYPDQMLVVGGIAPPSGDSVKCVDDGLIQVFNLSTAEWVNSYDPTAWSQYTVPATVLERIGGSGTGGATKLAPDKGWANSTLGDLFGTKYDATKIKKWYPYAKAVASPTPTPTLLPQPTPGNKTPAYLAPVLGVVLGLFFITLIILAILLWRRRKLLRSHNGTVSESGTIENSRWIDQWLRGTPAHMSENKAPTVTTTETPMSTYEEESQVFVHPPPVPVIPEMGNNQVYELGDSSKPHELHDTGFVPLTPSNGKSSLHPSPSVASQTSQTSQTSTVSHVSSLQPTRPGISPYASPNYSPSQSHSSTTDNPNTNTVPATTATPSNRIVSDMSAISETDRGHLRGISETSVSTIGEYATPPGIPSSTSPFGPDYYSQVRDRQRSIGRDDEFNSGRADGGRPSLVSPLSPPGDAEAGDYLSAGNTASGSGHGSSGNQSPGFVGSRTGSEAGNARRKSNFQETF